MMLVEIVVGTVLFCPVIISVLSYLLFMKLRVKKRLALGFAADVTTFVLFFSVPLAFKSIWGESYILMLLSVVLCIGLFVTFLDWRTKKEIEVPVLLKKIWRVYFLLLSVLYVAICMVGVVVNVLDYVAVS